uniref:Uncharacterized protein n=1 Tax=Candidatus Kentrum sp. LFY TaxID=2126342 RepID=A0A450UMU5_9GAMM|nr:MAG: hypothetical protein BECKLFY1418A_GA0070994_10353 [Candidatus Kentron sp. LFY]
MIGRRVILLPGYLQRIDEGREKTHYRPGGKDRAWPGRLDIPIRRSGNFEAWIDQRRVGSSIICNSSSTIDITARMFVVGRRVLAIVVSQKFMASFLPSLALGQGIPRRNDGSAEFLHNRLKQPLSSSRQGMLGPRYQGRQQDLVAASVVPWMSE